MKLILIQQVFIPTWSCILRDRLTAQTTPYHNAPDFTGTYCKMRLQQYTDFLHCHLFFLHYFPSQMTRATAPSPPPSLSLYRRTSARLVEPKCMTDGHPETPVSLHLISDNLTCDMTKRPVNFQVDYYRSLLARIIFLSSCSTSICYELNPMIPLAYISLNFDPIGLIIHWQNYVDYGGKRQWYFPGRCIILNILQCG